MVTSTSNPSDELHMRRAIEASHEMHGLTSPNPWVGSVVVAPNGAEYVGVTDENLGSHAEVKALFAAGKDALGSTLYVSLEPCAHEGNNPPCTQAIIDAGVERVVIAVTDPDVRVNGQGVSALQDAGIEVTTGVLENEARQELVPYITQRTTGRPYVVLKVAMTLDGKIAAPDGTSKWITDQEARRDVHLIRAQSDAVIVGAATVRADDPSLTVRLEDKEVVRQPLRVVLGEIPNSASINPALSWTGLLDDLLDELGSQGCLQVLVEGGGKVAGEFHRQGLIDRYIFFVAPALLGGNDGKPVMAGEGSITMADVWRGRLVDISRLGDDVKIVVDRPV